MVQSKDDLALSSFLNLLTIFILFDLTTPLGWYFVILVFCYYSLPLTLIYSSSILLQHL